MGKIESNFMTGFRLRRQRNRRKKLIKTLAFFLIAVSCIVIISNQFVKHKVNNPTTKNIQVKAKENSLKAVVENVLEGTTGTYGIAIKNFKNQQSYYINEHKAFTAGSLYKLWIGIVVYQQIQAGQLTEGQVLSEKVTVLNDEFHIDPASAEQTTGMITLSIHDALNQMITISHNYAALLLSKKIKLSSVATFLKENSFLESSVGTNGDSPKTTPSDIALFYEKLYEGKLANPEYSQEMINILKNQKLKDGLPKYLPNQLKVAHKTGDIGWFKHDGGIVYTDFGNYIIVIMSESDNPPSAQEKIALISKAVFNYFNN